ncbi:hypothetical protein MKX01_035419 [Papaver californicum]|nr:hypothetical protein MKX01_035419 [Papaver californicum]
MARRLKSTSKEQPNHVAATPAQQRRLSSLVDGSKLRGRAKDISDLMLLLDCHDTMVGHINKEAYGEKVTTVRTSRVASGSTVRVNSIIGVTGIGKSTLAQLCIQDRNVWKHFDHHIYWVSVSGWIDDKKRLASAIIEAIQKPVPQYYEWDPLCVHLKDCVKGKKFLLILDDVCGVDNVTWDEVLKPCLDAGALGSRILVTTQDRNLAAKMGSSSEDMLHLGRLSNEDSWLLLSDISLQGRTEEQIRDRETVGRELAKGCQGIPFLLKTLGYFLRDKKMWENVLDSGNWSRNSVEELLISSDASTSDLRECLKFCACLPNDYEIDKNILIKMWMAQGFLDRKQGDQMEMEMKGEEYFNILVLFSFLQGYERGGGVDDHGVILYKFYRPLHALAQSHAGNESCCIENGTSSCSAMLKYSRKMRHLTLIFKDDNVDTISPTLSQATKLRALKFIKSSRRWNPLMIPPNVFCQFIYLRALDMSYTSLHDLSPEIDNMTHLRYLNLSGSRFSKLLDTVCNLENLETLILNDCEELTRLPQKIGNLTKLRHLELQNTPKLRYFPEGFGRLNDLRTLSKFVIASSLRKCAKIGELKELNLLQGHLEIRGLNRVKSGADAMKAELGKKKHLRSLCLNFECDPARKPEVIKIMENVLEALNPFPEMRNNVEIRNYLSSKYPTWIDVSTRFTSN